MSWGDLGPDWECACGITFGGSKKKCGSCGWTYEMSEQYKKAVDIEKAKIGITDDEKLVADSERLLAKCSELNEQFKSMSEDTRIQWAKKEAFRKTVCDPAMQEFTESNDKLKVLRVEEIKVQAVEHELQANKGLMSSVARFVLNGLGIACNENLFT